MKNFLMLFILTFAISCTKDDEGKSALYIGSYSLSCNGHSWNGNVINISLIDYPDTLRGISLLRANPDNASISEALSFKNIILKPGIYPIDTMLYNSPDAKLRAFFSTTVDGDARGDYYWSPAQNSENYLVVESYDTTTRELKASFQVFLVTDPSRTKFDPSLPDTLRFTEGKISVKLDQD
ncbi:MAG: hypothetical protein IT270_02770 [Saprospiraceae bacterium]|nr:hypothetical protein [Saprospiraceae bacterium]